MRSVAWNGLKVQNLPNGQANTIYYFAVDEKDEMTIYMFYTFCLLADL